MPPKIDAEIADAEFHSLINAGCNDGGDAHSCIIHRFCDSCTSDVISTTNVSLASQSLAKQKVKYTSWIYSSTTGRVLHPTCSMLTLSCTVPTMRPLLEPTNGCIATTMMLASAFQGIVTRITGHMGVSGTRMWLVEQLLIIMDSMLRSHRR